MKGGLLDEERDGEEEEGTTSRNEKGEMAQLQVDLRLEEEEIDAGGGMDQGKEGRLSRRGLLPT